MPVTKLSAVRITTTLTLKYEQCLVTNLVMLSHALCVDLRVHQHTTTSLHEVASTVGNCYINSR